MTHANSVLICGAGAGAARKSYAKQFKEIWSLNETHLTSEVVPSLVIAMDDLERDDIADPRYCKRLFDGHEAPVLTTVAYPKWPRSAAYPLDETIAALGLPSMIARRLFNNSANYALALALAREKDVIGFHGVNFCFLDRKGEPEAFADLDWRNGPYGDDKTRPDWFKYHGTLALRARRPREPGIEAIHFLLGIACERGVTLSFAYYTTLLNLDREPYFYGFQEQPGAR